MPSKEANGHGPPFHVSLFRLLAGSAYLALVAGMFSGITGTPFVPVLLAVLAGAVFCTGLSLGLIARWAVRGGGRRGQFSLATMLLVTTLAAIYFGVVRWLVVNSRPSMVDGSHGLAEFGIIGAVCLFLAVLSIPFLLTMADSLVWLAVWIVERPAVRRWLSGRRPSKHNE